MSRPEGPNRLLFEETEESLALSRGNKGQQHFCFIGRAGETVTTRQNKKGPLQGQSNRRKVSHCLKWDEAASKQGVTAEHTNNLKPKQKVLK